MRFPAFSHGLSCQFPSAVGAVAMHGSQFHVKLRPDPCGWADAVGLRCMCCRLASELGPLQKEGHAHKGCMRLPDVQELPLQF